MPISDSSSIFTGDSYSPGSFQSSDPLERSVSKTNLAPAASLTQSKNDPTATTVDNTSIKDPGMTPNQKAAAGKGAVKAALVTTKFLLDLNSTRSAYRATTAEIQNNMMLSKLAEADTIARGKQNILDRKVEGQNASNQAMLHLAAQGLDVNSPGAQNTIKSYEAMGIYNAMREEANMYREAFKFDVEQAQLEFAKDMAAVNRDVQNLNSTLDFGGGMLEAGSEMVSFA